MRTQRSRRPASRSGKFLPPKKTAGAVPHDSTALEAVAAASTMQAHLDIRVPSRRRAEGSPLADGHAGVVPLAGEKKQAALILPPHEAPVRGGC